MKINMPAKDAVAFCDINIGGVFEVDNRVYMRTQGCTRSEQIMNAVNLKDGVFRHFNLEDEVTSLEDAVLVRGSSNEN